MPCLKFFFFFSRVKPGGWRRGDVRNELAGSQPSNLHPISERIALVYAGLTFFLMLAVRLCSVGCAQPLPQSIEAIRLTRSSRERRTPAPLTHTLSLSLSFAPSRSMNIELGGFYSPARLVGARIGRVPDISEASTPDAPFSGLL